MTSVRWKDGVLSAHLHTTINMDNLPCMETPSQLRSPGKGLDTWANTEIEVHALKSKAGRFHNTCYARSTVCVLPSNSTVKRSNLPDTLLRKVKRIKKTFVKVFFLNKGKGLWLLNNIKNLIFLDSNTKTHFIHYTMSTLEEWYNVQWEQTETSV